MSRLLNKIAVVGGGIAGPIFVRSLEQKLSKIPALAESTTIHLYEKKENSNTSSINDIGASLDLNAKSLKVIKEIGLYEDVLNISRANSNCLKFLGPTLNSIVEIQTPAFLNKFIPPQLEINRPLLCSLLLNSMNQNNVYYNKNIATVELANNNEHPIDDDTNKNNNSKKSAQLYLVDNNNNRLEEHKYDLVIGVNGGGRNELRKTVVDDVDGALFSQISSFQAYIRNTDIDCPKSNNDILHEGLLVIVGGDGTSIIAQRFGHETIDREITVYFNYKSDNDELSKHKAQFDISNFASVEEQLNAMKSFLKEMYSKSGRWNKSMEYVNEMIDACYKIQLRPWYSYPPIPNWRNDVINKLPITLMGDAAHAMTAFQGEGANQAIYDAIQLSDDLFSFINSSSNSNSSSSNSINNQQKLFSLLRNYEKKMIDRTAPITELSLKTGLYLASADIVDKPLDWSYYGGTPAKYLISTMTFLSKLFNK